MLVLVCFKGGKTRTSSAMAAWDNSWLAELAWIGDDLGMARGGCHGVAWLPAPSMDPTVVAAGSLGVRDTHASHTLRESRQRRS